MNIYQRFEKFLEGEVKDVELPIQVRDMLQRAFFCGIATGGSPKRTDEEKKAMQEQLMNWAREISEKQQ